MKVIAFVGLQASGKSEAAAVARKLSIPVIALGDVVREETRARGLPPSEEGRVAVELRQREGPAAVARRSAKRLDGLASPAVVLDGIRSHAEVEFFRGRLGDRLLLVRVVAPESVRFERVRRRARGDDGATRADFRARDRREEDFGIRRAMEEAAHEIRNDRDLDTFRREARGLLERLRAPPQERAESTTRS